MAQEKDYIDFYEDASRRGLCNTSFADNATLKATLLEIHFPGRFKPGTFKTWEPKKVGSVYQKLIDYSKDKSHFYMACLRNPHLLTLDQAIKDEIGTRREKRIIAQERTSIMLDSASEAELKLLSTRYSQKRLGGFYTR